MSAQRKISPRKIIQTLLTIVLLGCCVLVMLSASKIQDQKKIKGVDISIQNDELCQFVGKNDVEQILFERRHMKPGKIAVGAVDLGKMEHILSANPWIENTQVFLDNNKYLNIHVTQRMPQLRVFQRNGHSYYIDSSRHVLPLSDNYTQYEILFVNVPEVRDDSVSDLLKRRMLDIAGHIKRNAFWQAQTSEIVVNSLDDFQLIPVLGNHKILLGNAKGLDQKFENLFAFYENILNKVGWDRYTVLDARFRNQIVASPSLPWKVPLDRALTNMNWVKTIVGSGPKEELKTALPAKVAVAKKDSTKTIQ